MVLVDSNVLMRVLQRGHPMYKDASQAVRILHKKKELVLVPQNIVEVWVVATRPMDVNGLGMTLSRAAMLVHGVQTIVTFNGADFRRYPGINILHPREIFAGQ